MPQKIVLLLHFNSANLPNSEIHTCYIICAWIKPSLCPLFLTSFLHIFLNHPKNTSKHTSYNTTNYKYQPNNTFRITKPIWNISIPSHKSKKHHMQKQKHTHTNTKHVTLSPTWPKRAQVFTVHKPRVCFKFYYILGLDLMVFSIILIQWGACCIPHFVSFFHDPRPLLVSVYHTPQSALTNTLSTSPHPTWRF